MVNEPYAFLLLPLLLWEEAERPSEGKRFLFRAAYGLPLAYAILNVPILMFLLPLYLHLVQRPPTYAYGLERALPREWQAVILTFLAFAFVALLVYAWRILVKEARHEAVSHTPRRPDSRRPGLEPADSPVG